MKQEPASFLLIPQGPGADKTELDPAGWAQVKGRALGYPARWAQLRGRALGSCRMGTGERQNFGPAVQPSWAGSALVWEQT